MGTTQSASSFRATIEGAFGKPLADVGKEDIKNLIARGGEGLQMLARWTPTKIDDAVAALLIEAAKDGGVVDAIFALIQKVMDATK